MLCTPIFRTQFGTKETGYSDSYVLGTTNLKLTDYVDSVKQLGKVTHSVVCDNYYEANVDAYNWETYLSDGTHPFIQDGTGTKHYAERIYAQMYANL